MEYQTGKFPANVEKIENADIVVFGVPFDSTVDYLPGTRFGPKIIREASNFIELFDIDEKKNLLDTKKIIDIGDLEPVRADSLKMVEKISEKVSEIVKKNKFFVMLGGEHLISLGAVNALGKDVKIVSFDAHYDLKEVWEGSEYTHSTWLRRASEIVGEKNVCLVGVRAGDEFELEFSEKMLVNPSKEKLKEFVKSQKVYLTIDMDVFDTGIAPGVGTPEPSGMNVKEFLEYLEIVCQNSKIVGMDVVEARPLQSKITEILAAKIIFKALLKAGVG